MKKIAQVLPLIFFVFISTTFAQETITKWIRVQSNNGEFSIEVPTQSNYFYDKEVFTIGIDSSTYYLKEMSMINAYKEKTLLSFETYAAKKDALKGFYQPDKGKNNIVDIKLNTITAKQVIYKKDNIYSKSLYFYSKKNIFVVTAVSKNGETSAMKHFFDSIIFNADTKTQPNAAAVPFSSLNVTAIDLKFPKESEAKTEKKVEIPKDEIPKDENLNKLTIISKPKPAYTDSARARGVQGLIRLKVLFSQDGFMPKIEVSKSLPEGLLRQVIFSAIRIKFLPEEKDGNPQSVTKTIEYNFTLY